MRIELYTDISGAKLLKKGESFFAWVNGSKAFREADSNLLFTIHKNDVPTEYYDGSDMIKIENADYIDIELIDEVPEDELYGLLEEVRNGEESFFDFISNKSYALSKEELVFMFKEYMYAVYNEDKDIDKRAVAVMVEEVKNEGM